MHLTPRQWQVTELVSQGMKNAEIGAQVGTTDHVIKNYLRDIFDETGMSTRLELALWYLAHTPVELRKNADGDLYFEI